MASISGRCSGAGSLEHVVETNVPFRCLCCFCSAFSGGRGGCFPTNPFEGHTGGSSVGTAASRPFGAGELGSCRVHLSRGDWLHFPGMLYAYRHPGLYTSLLATCLRHVELVGLTLRTLSSIMLFQVARKPDSLCNN